MTAPAGKATNTRLLWHFGDMVLDESARELRRAGQAVEVEPKPIELLMFLLRRTGEVVSREEIQEAVWPRRVLGDGSVTNCIAKLREALNDHDQTLVRTVQRSGYRFTAEVRLSYAEQPVQPPDAGFEAGGRIPLRPGWRLARRLSAGGGPTQAWLVERTEDHEQRVLRLAQDAAGVALLKHEAGLLRTLREKRPEAADYRALLDWNFDELPFYLEFAHHPGGSLREWCEQQGGAGALALETRVELAAQAAAAVAAAHAAGVIHNRLEPSNLLVDTAADGSPRLRLSDFAAGRGADGPAQAAPEAAAALPAGMYRAPELLAGQPPTAQSDIYALGVILFQLVTGDLRRPLAPGWEEQVADPLLREDIAAAVAGDTGRRLADAAELAARLRRLPARRTEREAQRNSAIAAQSEHQRQLHRRNSRDWLTSLALIALFAGSLSIALYLRARAAEEQAQDAAAAMTALSTILAAEQPPSIEAIDQVADSLKRQPPGQPLVRARFQLLVGKAYAMHGSPGKAQPLLRQAEQGFAAALGPQSAEAQQARDALGEADRAAGRPGELGKPEAAAVAAVPAAPRVTLSGFFVLGGPLALVFTLIQYGLWLRERGQVAYWYWGNSDLAGWIGLILFLLRGEIPWWASTQVSNVLIVVSGFMTWAGMNRFAGQRIRTRWFTAGLLGYLAVQVVCLTLFSSELRLRMALLSLVLAAINAGNIFDMFRAQRQRWLGMRSVLIVVMGLHGAFYLFRATRTLTLEPGTDIMNSAATNDLAIIIAMVRATLVNLAAVLMVQEIRHKDRGTPHQLVDGPLPGG